MLTANQFRVLSALHALPRQTQRELCAACDLSLGTISSVITALRDQTPPAITERNELTPAGKALLEPYRVRNAVIMAAGLSSRFAPISYEKPKGLLTVKGEVLIERQIKQLQAAGIQEIYLVLGYKQEEFFYLENMFGVHIRINEEYMSRNNNSTIKCVADILDNTYICSSDDYFASNPFEPYVYQSYYAVTFAQGSTDEYCVAMAGKNNDITSVCIGGADAWIMLGHAYWDRAFSQTFVAILNDEYNSPGTAAKLWEDIYIDHLAQLPMVARMYEPGIIWEFDSLNELSDFDPAFIQNVDSTILDNICNTLHCAREDIKNITPLKQGQINLSFRFSVGNSCYVYRHPNEEIQWLINRQSETCSETIAHELGFDTTFIYEDPKTGWKLSYYLEGARALSYNNKDEVCDALRLLRRLHTCGSATPWTFDMYAQAHKILDALDDRTVMAFKDFPDLLELAAAVHEIACASNVEPCLCHNAFYDQNILVRDIAQGDRCFQIDLIDWEYSGMGDYGSDLGSFVCCTSLDVCQALEMFEMYFGRTATPAEQQHCIAWVALASFYWFVWALYIETRGKQVGEWLYLWYKNLKVFGEKALKLAQA